MLCTGEHTWCYHVLALIDLLCNSHEAGVPGSCKDLHTRVLWGCLSWFKWESSGTPLMLSTPLSCNIVEHSFQQKQAPLLPADSVPLWMLFLHLIQKQLGPEGPVCYLIGAACSLGKPLLPFSQYCKIAMIQGNQLLHSVTNDLCLNNFNSSLIKSAKCVHFWTHIRQTTLLSQLWGPCISQLI